MKSLLIALIAVGSLCCSNDVSTKTTSKPRVKFDYATCTVNITNFLPIGWGTKYKCDVVSFDEGLIPVGDTTFILGVNVGDEFDPPLGIGTYQLEFKRTSEISETSYLPSGTTGMMDKNKVVWDLIRVSAK